MNISIIAREGRIGAILPDYDAPFKVFRTDLACAAEVESATRALDSLGWSCGRDYYVYTASTTKDGDVVVFGEVRLGERAGARCAADDFGSAKVDFRRLVAGGPLAGMGASGFYHSDRHPFTVARVSPGAKSVWVYADNSKVRDGSTDNGSARWSFSARDGRVEIGPYRMTKRGWSHKGHRLHVGSRDRYHDPHF